MAHAATNNIEKRGILSSSKDTPEPVPIDRKVEDKGIPTPPVPKRERKEVDSERSASSKVFDNGDGTYTQNFYSSPVNRKNNGKWDEISGNLVDSKDNTDEINSQSTDINVHFLKKMKSGEYVTFAKDLHTLSYSFLEGDGENGTVPSTDEKASINQSQIFFENPIPNLTLRNIVFNSQVKEDIILNQYSGYNIFRFKIDTDLQAEKQSDGQITFSDSNGTVIFTLPKPFMTDSTINPLSGEPNRSDNVDYSIQKNGDSWILTLTADTNWLKDPSRKFPIYIDPTTSLSTAADTFTSSAYPTTNYDGFWDSAEGYYALKVGYYDSTTGTNYGFVKPNFSGLDYSVIDSSTFNIYTGHSYYPTTANGVWLDTVNGSWAANTLNWSNQPTSTNISSTTVHQGQWASFDVTNTVQGWANNTSTNYGFKLHMNGNGQPYWKKFYASENSTNKPYLSVNYHFPTTNAPTGNAYSDGTGSNNTGYVNLNWNAVTGATGYKVWIFNGVSYQSYSVGNVTSWSTKGEGIWPTQDEINAGGYTLHTDKKGTDLPSDPSPVYKNSGGSYPTRTNYWFRISAVFAGGESDLSVSSQAYIPLEPPAAPTGTATSYVSGNSGYVKLNWTKNPKATGYKVWIFNGLSYESYDAGNTDHWTTQNQKIWPTPTEITGGRYLLHHINDPTDPGGVELAADPSPVYKNSGGSYSTRTNYWFRVSAYNNDSESEMSISYSPTIQGSGQVSITSPSDNTTTSGTLTVTGTTDLDKMNLSATKYGTNNVINLGDITGANGSWNWDTTQVSDGEYVLTLTGYDSLGNTISSKINVVVENVSQGMGLDYGGIINNHIGSVNMANGNFVVSKTDFKLPGRGLGTNFTRVYNSQMQSNGVLGWGWRIAVPELSQYSDGSVMIMDENGDKQTYSFNTDGSYTSPKGDYDILTKNTNGTFTLQSKDGSKYVFDPTNNKVSQIDRNNNSVVYQSDTNNKLISITDPTNRVMLD